MGKKGKNSSDIRSEKPEKNKATKMGYGTHKNSVLEANVHRDGRFQKMLQKPKNNQIPGNKVHDKGIHSNDKERKRRENMKIKDLESLQADCETITYFAEKILDEIATAKAAIEEELMQIKK